MKRAMKVSNTEGIPEQTSRSAMLTAQSSEINQKLHQSLDYLLKLQIEHAQKSLSYENSKPEFISTEHQIPKHDNGNLRSLGCLNISELKTEQNLEHLKVHYEQPIKTKNLEALSKSSVILTPEMAEEVLVLLDAMVLRLIQCEAKALTLLNDNEIGAQEKINNAKSLIKDIPRSVSRHTTSAFIMEICGFVESVFCTHDGLITKLVECRTNELSETVRDLDTNLKAIKTIGKLPPFNPNKKEVLSEDGVLALEIGSVSICLILLLFVMYLLTNPLFGDVVIDFYVNSTRRFF